jgi:alpha-L-rhamnosidase
VAPQPGGGLTWAKASLETPRGQVATGWILEDGRLEVTVTVPEGATALLRLPDGSEQELEAGRHTSAQTLG